MAGTDLQGIGRKKLRYQITLIILGMSALKFIVHMAVSGNYELYRDAFLYISYADHPEWGYFNNPPFIMVLSAFASKLGGSAFVMRFFPALAGAISMYLVGALTKELGGKKWAVIMATVSYLVAPIFLRVSGTFQPLAFDQLFWFLYLFFFVRLLQTHNKNYWFILGLVAGVGFLTQYTILVPVVLTTLFLIATRHRKLLWVPQFWGFIINLAILSIPNLIWQYNHHWPELEILKDLKENQLLNLDRGWFLGMQFIMFAPVLFVWMPGLYSLFAKKELRKYIVLGYSMLGVVLLMLLLHAKAHYTAPFYMVLLVFGAIQWENWLEQKYKGILASLIALSILVSFPLLPLSLPYKNADDMIAFGDKLKSYGLQAPFVWQDGEVHELPEDYALMVGWRELSALTNNAYLSLSDSEKMQCAIMGADYGKSTSVNYYHRKNKDIPKAFSIDGSEMFWSPETLENVEVLIYIGDQNNFIRENFEEMIRFGQVDLSYSAENGTAVYICKKPKNAMPSAYAAFRESKLGPYHRHPYEHDKD